MKRNYRALCEEIEALRRSEKRDITLVAVTKGGTDDEVLALLECGVGDIGENRPQMLVARRELLLSAGYTPHLHEIGNLQKNKIKHIIESVALIHSVGTLELGAEISRHAERVGRRVPILIEVNSAAEAAKGGVSPDGCEELFLELRKLPGLVVSGLMTMGPVCENPEDLRPYFRLTRELFDTINNNYGFDGTPTLSMGMSDSYRIAIEEGSTMVRVGSLLWRK